MRPVSVDGRLAELDHGAFEGLDWDEIHESDPVALARWGLTWLDEGPSGGESASELEARVRAWHAELAAGEVHLLLAHAGVVRALTVIRQGLTWSDAMEHGVPALTPIEL